MAVVASDFIRNLREEPPHLMNAPVDNSLLDSNHMGLAELRGAGLSTVAASDPHAPSNGAGPEVLEHVFEPEQV